MASGCLLISVHQRKSAVKRFFILPLSGPARPDASFSISSSWLSLHQAPEKLSVSFYRCLQGLNWLMLVMEANIFRLELFRWNSKETDIDHDFRAHGQVALGCQVLQDANIGRTSL